MFGIKEITQYCKELSAKVNDTFDIPVYLNGRLTKTLGRAHSETVGNGIWMPTRLEFSKRFLETSTDECVKSVIEHEWAHYYTVKRTGESHGHDAEFKAMCARIGLEDARSFGNVEYKNQIAVEKPKSKYSIYCTKCGKLVAARHRRCPVVDRPEDFTANCCGAPVKCIMNW